MRLDWLMWFEAMARRRRAAGSSTCWRAVAGRRGALSLLRTNPFPGAPPRYVRAQYYRYRFTTPDERRESGLWWDRQLVGTFYGPVSLAAR